MTRFEEIEVGATLETAGRTVTGADVANFAGVSGDFNDLHTDAERMAESGFGGRIAHGALVFSISTGLLWQARRRPSHVVAFYGIDCLRFVAPVFLGDTVSATSEVVGKEPREYPTANGVVRREVTVSNQAGETVLSYEMLTLVE
ncbi:MaoC/PaaZ C-terminal domain-containing protein [Halalkalicoccus tibetensis]|uniref:MaoC/PaaZ C-terminal domain-containing protein n=1 Tax=Halalkalicoccus tibetensis TaxID=175632 RepID=A0ABD5UZL4_9EURY